MEYPQIASGIMTLTKKLSNILVSKWGYILVHVDSQSCYILDNHFFKFKIMLLIPISKFEL